MKNLIMVALVLFALQVNAQKKEHHNKQDRHQKMENISAEDMATLQTKKMTLALDLNSSQQAQVKALNLENATKRKEMMATRKARKDSGEAKKPTQEQRLKMANSKLDHKIAMKAKMKNILNKEQYAKYEKSQARMAMKGKNKVVKKANVNKNF